MILCTTERTKQPGAVQGLTSGDVQAKSELAGWQLWFCSTAYSPCFYSILYRANRVSDYNYLLAPNRVTLGIGAVERASLMGLNDGFSKLFQREASNDCAAKTIPRQLLCDAVVFYFTPTRDYCNALVI